MTDSIWVAWPDNLTDDEMNLYLERYGTPPDLVPVDFDFKTRVDLRDMINAAKQEEPKDEA